MSRLLLLPLFLFLSVNLVFADARSDFDYQYSKYRENYAEFLIFKKDYLTQQTLDNQQKALLSAKASITTRDLTKASFAAYVRDLIVQSKIRYEPLNPVNKVLLEAQQFFLSEASKGQSIVTLADLEEFNKKYNETYPQHERSIKLGIVAHKLAKQKSFALQQEVSLANLKVKVANKVSVRVVERIANLEDSLNTIHKKIDDLAIYLTSEESLENTDSEVFFSSKIEVLSETRNLQLDWIEQLIDLDLNYGKI